MGSPSKLVNKTQILMESISFWYDDIGNLPPPSLLLTNVDSVCQVPSLKLAVEFKQLLME